MGGEVRVSGGMCEADGHTVNLFPNIVTYCEANKGSNTTWKHQHQNLVGVEEVGCNLHRYKEEATAKTSWAGNER